MERVHPGVPCPATLLPADPSAGEHDIEVGGRCRRVFAPFAQLASAPAGHMVLSSPASQQGFGDALPLEQFSAEVPFAVDAALKARPSDVVPPFARLGFCSLGNDSADVGLNNRVDDDEVLGAIRIREVKQVVVCRAFPPRIGREGIRQFQPFCRNKSRAIDAAQRPRSGRRLSMNQRSRSPQHHDKRRTYGRTLGHAKSPFTAS